MLREDKHTAIVAAIALAAALVATGPLAPAERAQAFTVPGSPGTPQPPTPLYTEDFSAIDATPAAMSILDYQGSPGTQYIPGVSGAGSETYTADPAWTPSFGQCNGWVLNATSPQPTTDAGCASGGWGAVTNMTGYLGQYQGMTATAARKNQAVTAFTSRAARAGVQFETKAPIPALAGHFYQVTAVFIAAACSLTGAQPQERFSLIVNGTPTVLGSNLNPCTDPSRILYPLTNPGNSSTYASSLRSAALKVPSTGTPELGIQLYNEQSQWNGNDAAFDLPQILDVTPQLDKSFSPSTIASGQTSTLTFTVTNTTELGAKNGWSFLDNLPDGVTATGVNGTTCSNATVTASAGSGSVRVSNGSLNQGQNACTVTVQVTASTPGTYVNGPGNFPDGTAGLDGLNPPADTTLTVSPPASLNITKSSTTTAITRVGQVVTYKFTVVNRSLVTLRNLEVADTQLAPAVQANLSPVLCETTVLAPQDSTTCTARYTVTQADLDHGSLRDTATATAVNPVGGAVDTPPASLTIGTSRPAIAVEKSSTTTLVNAVGQQVPYAFRVTNTGNVTLFGVAVADTQTPPASQGNMSAVTCPQPALAPGESQVCTGTYTATQADLQNGTLNDSATASGEPEDGAAVVSAPSRLSIPTQLPGSLTIQKSTTTAAVTAVGQQIPYTFLVTNNSSVTVNGITVVDTVEPPSLPGNLSTPTCGVTSLTPGASTTCTATYQVTQADVNQGLAADSAIAQGRDANNNPVQSSPSRVVLHSPISALTVVKSTSATSVSAVGQQVPYSFVVTNTGNQPLTQVSVADTQVAPASQANMSAVSCPQSTLAAGESITCTGTYTVTAADIANGSVNDFATASGRNPSNALVTSPQSSATVTATTAALTLVKASSTNAYTQIGQVVRYTFTVANTSSTVYNDIAIQDTQVAPAVQGNLSVISCDTTTLAPGDSAVCTASYSVTAADITNGFLTDFATATGVDVGGSTYTTARSSVILPALQNPAITLTKTSTVTRISGVGQQVPYTFTVRNTGNVTVTGVQVADTQSPPASQANMSAVTCPPGALQPGETADCTGTYTVTRADLDNGFLRDTATATAIAPDGSTVNAPQAQLRITSNPALQIQKSTTTTLVDTIGQVVPYTFQVTNIRSTPVTNVRVDDTVLFPSSQSALSAIVCDDLTLAPGASTTCRGTYTATAADIANGSVNDTAVAEGTDANGLALPPSEPSTVSIPTQKSPSLSIAKSSNTAVVTRVGQDIAYQFVVTNTGNVAIGSIDVEDTLVPPADPANLTAVSCPVPTLEPGQNETCTAHYLTTAADLANGSVADQAVATGLTGDGTAVSSPPDALSIPAPATPPAISIVKSSSSIGISVLNEQIPYTFTVANNSAAPLTDVRVVDTQIAPAVQSNLSAISCPATTLAAGASMTCTARYTTTQPDFDHGRVDDSAVAVGTDPGGTQAQSDPSTFSVPVDPVELGLSIQKHSTTTVVTQIGQQIPYQFVVTNTGTQTLSSISVTDTVSAPSVQSNLSAVTCPPGGLLPDKSVTCTATYTATEADLNNGSVADTASASGKSPSNVPVNSAPAALSIPAQQAPALTVTKSSTTSSVTRVGEVVPYEFVVRNTGNVTLMGVNVTDAVAPPALPGNLSPVTCPTTTVAPGAQITCTAQYQVAQDDVFNGSLTDTATAAGTPPATPDDPNPTPVTSPPSSVTVPIVSWAELTVVKSSTATVTAVGQQVPYEFLVTNTGTLPLSAITVTDTVAAPSDPANLSAVTCPATELAPNAQMTCTAQYTTTQADVDNGTVTDTATSTGTPPATLENPDPTPVDSPPSTVSLVVAGGPALTVAKSSTSAPPTTVGQQISYEFLVTNTGNVTMTDITVTDTVAAPSDPANLSAIDCPVTTLAPGAQTTCTATYTVTQADIDHGAASDTATASGLPPATPGNPNPPRVSSGDDPLTVAIPQSTALTVVKSSTTTTVTTAGQQIPYDFVVTNTGNVTMTGLTITDTVAAPSDPANLSSISCPVTSLPPGDSVTCTATYTVGQADVDNGTVGDTATAAATPPATPDEPNPVPVDSPPSTVEIPVAAQAGLTVVKETTTATVETLGQRIPYTFRVTNTGTVTLTGIAVTDTVAAPSLPGDLTAVSCPATVLAPSADMTCTAEYTVSQADLDSGSVGDTATATGLPPATAADPDPAPIDAPPSTVVLAVGPLPALTVAKASTTQTIARAGQIVPYTFTVANPGLVTVTGITVADTVAAPSDPSGLSPVVCPATELAPGSSMECTAAYTTTQADVDSGAVADTASASGASPGGTPVDAPDSTVAIPVDASAGLTVVKSSTTTEIAAAGETVPYRFTVTNTGAVTLTGIAVTDTVAAPSDPANLTPIDCPATTLAPAATMECTAEYTTTAADVDHGTVSDTASASAAAADGTAVLAPESTVTLPVTEELALALVKSTTTTAITGAGQVVPYTFTVQNTGNRTLTGVTVTDRVAPPSDPAALSAIDCPATTLAPGASMECTATYQASQADVDAGAVTDTASATATGPGGATVTAPDSEVTVAVDSTPGLEVVKASTTGSVTAVGQQIPYTFTVTNTGNTTISDIAVMDTVAAPSDPANLTAPSCPQTSLAPGASIVCTAAYTVTQADLDNGSVADTAAATGTDPDGAAVTSPPSGVVVGVDQRPALTLVKSATRSGDPSTPLAVGERVRYTFVVTNTGNVTEEAPTIDETAFTGAGPAPAVTCPAGALPPGAQVVCTSDPYIVLPADAAAGRIDNTAVATVPPVGGTPVSSPPSSFDVPFVPAPELQLIKSVSPTVVTAADGDVQYTFEVTNTGNVPVDALAIDEVAFSGTGVVPEATCAAGELLPGQRTTCTAPYAVTQADMDAGVIDNTARASAQTEDTTHAPVASNDSSALVAALDAPALTLAKTATPSVVHTAGETVTFRYVIENTGNVTLLNPSIVESAFTGTGTLPPADCPASLAPGATGECTTSYTVTQADIDAGTVSNTATAHAETAAGAGTDSDPATAAFTVTQAPAVAIVKSVAIDHDTAMYTFVVTDTGNTSLTGIQVTETGFTGTGAAPTPDCPDVTLQPGESVTCTAQYQLTAADREAGMLGNTAAVTAAGPGGAAVDGRPSTAEVELAGGSGGGSSTPPAAPGNGSGTGLAATGSALPTGLAIAAALLLFSGIAALSVVAVRRRRRQEGR